MNYRNNHLVRWRRTGVLCVDWQSVTHLTTMVMSLTDVHSLNMYNYISKYYQYTCIWSIKLKLRIWCYEVDLICTTSICTVEILFHINNCFAAYYVQCIQIHTFLENSYLNASFSSYEQFFCVNIDLLLE